MDGVSAPAANSTADDGETVIQDTAAHVAIEPVGSVAAGAKARFVATVRNTASPAIRWALAETNAGTIDASTGEYRAPIRGGRFHATAVSVSNPEAFATIEFEVANVTVRMAPPEIAVAASATYAMRATVESASNDGIVWSVQEEEGGSIDPESGVYVAPSKPGVYHVIATSALDPSSHGVTTVSVPSTPIAITPMAGIMEPGGTRVFGASIAQPSQAVTWRVVEAAGGSITKEGVYTAPSEVNGVFHVVATSVADPSKVTTVPVMIGQLMPAITNEGGPVVRHPKFVPVTFNDDPLAPKLDSFAAQYGATSIWRDQTSEYGVGAASGGTPVHLHEELPAAMDNDALATWLANKLDGTHPELGTASPDTIYTLYIPATTVVTTGFGKTCAPLGGYHSFTTLANGTLVPYAVIAHCRANDIDWTTQLTSHELVEAATDPQVNWNQAYAFSDDSHAIWGLMHPETADLCEWDTISSQTNFTPDSFGYRIQRTWSNAAAAAGHDPCVPALPGQIYFRAIPNLDASVTMSAGGRSFGTNGVAIAVGHSKTIDVNLVSDGPRGRFNVTASDMGANALKFKLDHTAGASGDTLHLTITVLSKGKSYGGTPFEIVAFDGEETHTYFGFVAN